MKREDVFALLEERKDSADIIWSAISNGCRVSIELILTREEYFEWKERVNKEV